MEHLLAQLDTLFTNLTGITSRTVHLHGKTILVQLGKHRFELSFRSRTTPQEQYYATTRHYTITLNGPITIPHRIDALLQQYVRLLAAHDRQLHQIFRLISDQPVLIEQVYTHNGRTQRKECRLFVTLRCNQKCMFCQNIDQIDHRSLKDVRALLDDYCQKNKRWLSRTELAFTGGEPTIAPYLIPLIRYAHTKGFRNYTLQTNGVALADRKMTQQLLHAGIDSLFISFHSSKERNYDRLTGTHGQFKKALAGIHTALQYPFTHVTFNMVLTKLNYKDIIPLVKQLGSIPADPATVVRFFPSVLNENRSWEKLSIRYSSIVPYMIKALRSVPSLVKEFSGDCSFPVCIGDLHAKIPSIRPAQNSYGKTKYVPANKSIPSNGPYTRVKRLECKKCIFNVDCAGLPKPYAQRFGVSELKPIS